MQELSLRIEAEGELFLSQAKAWQHIESAGIRRPSWEPLFVAHLCRSVAGLASRWAPIVRALDPTAAFSALSVFTHQSPYVRWPAGRCELADLLVAIIDSRHGAGHAILLQAKQADNGSTSLSSGSEKTQFQLLTGRPVFDVDQKDAPGPVDLTGYSPDEALLYGLTPPDAKRWPPIARWPSRASWHWWSKFRGVAPFREWETVMNLQSVAGSYVVHHDSALSEILVRLLHGDAGWAFTLPPVGADWRHFAACSPRDDWSMLINYLLERTAKLPLVQLRGVAGASSRGAEGPLWFRGPQDKFAVVHHAADAAASTPLSHLVSAADAGRIEPSSDWRLADMPGDGGDGDNPPPFMLEEDDDGPRNGSISVLVLELGELRDRSSPHESRKRYS